VPSLQPETTTANAASGQARRTEARRMAAHIIRGRMSRTLTLTVATALALGGCGGGSSAGGGGGRSVTVAAGQPVSVTATEYRFDPARITVAAGTVRFDLRNDGSQAHDLRVEKNGQDLGGTAIFGPRQSQSGQVKLAAGTYQFICSVGNHADLGMKGTLAVK
jgi:plastocyanin